MEYQIVPLPLSLDPNSPDKPFTFVISSSHPSSLIGLDKGAVGELLSATSAVLSRSLMVHVGTGVCPESAIQEVGVQDNVKTVVLVGASVLGRTAGRLTEEGYKVIDMCIPGWKIAPENVAEVVGRLRTVPLGSNMAVILDLFGNSCFRAKLFDGSTTLPIKGNGHFHLPGEVTVCGEDIFARLVDTVGPIFDAVKGRLLVVLPPQPRHLFKPCCEDKSHCSNMADKGHAAALLAKTFKLRHVLKKRLADQLGGQHWVMDTCSCVNDPGSMSMEDKLEALKKASASDGVHLAPSGYDCLAKNIAATVTMLQAGLIGGHNLQKSAGLSVSGHSGVHFWRGFSSPVGSRRQSHVPAWAKHSREWSYRAKGPYEMSKFKRK